MWQLSLEVKTFSRVLLLALLAISAILSWVEASWAESLRDPTQIPAGMLASETAKNTSSTEQTSGPVLQSVMLGAQYRAAIINGKKIKLGELFEKATLVALSENSATLRNPDGTKLTLKMLAMNLPEGAVKKTSVKMSFYPPKHQASAAQNSANQNSAAQNQNTEKVEDALLITSDSNPNAKVK